MKSVYHVREYEVHKLKRIQEPVDVFVSHDWPRGIANYGDKEGLLRVKPYFREEVSWLKVSTCQ
jgi:lariat debranching enzyme